MAKPPNILSRLRDLISPKQAPVKGGEIAAIPQKRRRMRMPIDQEIVRPIKGDKELTHEICEIALWSQEFAASIGALTTDCFQQISGQSGSWSIAETQDGSEDGVKTNPDIVAIGKEVATRMYNGRYVLGGDRLQATALDYFQFGDGFLELEIGRDGTGDYCITRSAERPSLQMFPVVDEFNEILYYALRSGRSSFEEGEEVQIPRWKTLHLSRFPNRSHLGRPASLEMVDSAWRPLKETAVDLSEAIRSAGSSMLVHEMSAAVQPDDRQAYIEDVQQRRSTGAMLDLFAYNGTKINELGKAGDRVDALFKAFTSYRSMMIPFGVPSWAFPAISGRQDSNKDIANQPALLYARQIADMRSKMGEKIKWAIALEIVLKKGYDFYAKSGGFEIVWGDWFVTGMEQGMMQQGKEQGRGDNQQLNQMNAMLNSIHQQQQRSIDLINTHKVIAEAMQGGSDFE